MSAGISFPVILELRCLRYREGSSHSLGISSFILASTQAELSLSSSKSSSNRKLILAGQIAFLPTGILTTLLGPMLPILIARWAMNDTQAGNLFLVQFLGMLVGVQLSGILLARPAVQRGIALDVPGRRKSNLATDEEARKILFGQRAR